MPGADGALVGGLRAAYLAVWTRDVAATQTTSWRGPSFDYAFADENGDRLIDWVRFAVRLEPGTLSPSSVYLGAYTTGPYRADQFE